jgi:hypothetical protein
MMIMSCIAMVQAVHWADLPYNKVGYVPEATFHESSAQRF